MIGDKGLAGKGDNLYVLDLGQAWRELTGLPFVWALWIGSHGLDEDLADHLREAKEWGVHHLDEVIPRASKSSGFDEETCRHYLRETMNFDLTEDHVKSHRLYGELLVKHGLIECAYQAQHI
jgi:chorismate dehydratase